MTTTNGHPTLKPGDLTPERRPVKRTLYVEEEDNGITSAWEATRDDVIAWLRDNGGTDMLTSEESVELAKILSAPPRVIPKLAEALRGGNEPPVTTGGVLGTTPSGEAVRMVGAERAEVGKMPSASDYVREHINNHEFGGFRDEGQAALATCRAIVAYLDEQALKGPNR